jgi:hypothetical protein
MHPESFKSTIDLFTMNHHCIIGAAEFDSVIDDQLSMLTDVNIKYLRDSHRDSPLTSPPPVSVMARVRSASLDDPFAVHMAPPEGETPDQRTARLAAAQNAEKMSRQIDEALLQSKKSLDKKRSDVKILLLGT